MSEQDHTHTLDQQVVASPAPGVQPSKASPIKGVLTVILMVAFSILIIYVTTRYRDTLQELGHAGYIGIFLVSIIGNATIIFPAPVFIVACAAGIVYGPIAVGIVSGFGAALGELTGYFAGRGGAAVIPDGVLYQRLEQFMRRNGMLAIFLLAAIPNPIFDIGGIMAGMLRMKAWQFVLSAALGKALRLGIMAYICMGGLPFLRQIFHP